MNSITHPFWPTIGRGICGRCPQCGDGILYRSYLKPVDNCSHCNEKLGHIRADDGPAWLTIILVTHIITPIIVLILTATEWPMWISFLAITVPAVALLLLMLPRAKGLFIAWIWRSGCVGAEE